MSKVLPLSRWKKHPQLEREEYSDDEVSNDLFEEPDVEEVIKTPPKSKRKPEINSSRKKRKPLPKISKKTKPRKRPPSSAASPSNAKRSRPNAKKSIPPPPAPCEPTAFIFKTNSSFNVNLEYSNQAELEEVRV